MEFNFKKKYGQNFLIDDNIIKKITSYVDAKEDDLILEIGPGSGNLTKELVKFNCLYIGFEIDTDTKKYLAKYENNNTEFIYDDFLKCDIKTILENKKYNRLFIVANLPYYITTPIIKKITDSNIEVYKQILMVQNEVADRLSSEPKSKDYGYITIYLNYFYIIKKLFVVKRECFIPSPNVDSAVIMLETRKNKEDIDIALFNKLVSTAFLSKRKTIKNNLKGYDLKVIENVLLNNGLSLQSRPEEIDYKVYIEIIEELLK